MGDRSDLGSIAFGLTGDGPEGCKVTGVLVGEADLATWDPVGVLHPNVEVLAMTAWSKQGQGFATAPSDNAHSIDPTYPHSRPPGVDGF
jgi:hypothetical protein